jgi:hypothetical protein
MGGAALANAMSDNKYYVKSDDRISRFQILPARINGISSVMRLGLSETVRQRDRQSVIYIRYFPKSSSLRPSSHLRNSSLLAGSALTAFLEFFRTSSST